MVSSLHVLYFVKRQSGKLVLFFCFFLVTLLFDITKIKEKLLFSIRELKKPACLGSKYIWKEML